VDVLEPAGGFVEEVLGVAIAEDAAGDADLVPIDAELLLAIGEPQGDLSHAEGGAGIGAREDDVGHLAAAEGLRGLLAEDPAHGVEDVGFAAAIGADDGGDALVEIQHSLNGEGLETEDLERLEVHGN
jgi:hypothetical protein